VLYIDAEIQKPFWKKRVEALCKKRGLGVKDVMQTRRIRPAFVAGKEVSATKLKAEFERLYERGELSGVDLVIIDPIYQFYDPEWQENRNEDMAKLGQCLRFISELTGVSISRSGAGKSSSLLYTAVGNF
jgi:RecA-family ATPase